MSFLSDLHEAIEDLWPILCNYSDHLDSFKIGMSLVDSYIDVQVTLTGGHEISASIPWEDTTDSLIDELREALRGRSRDLDGQKDLARNAILDYSEAIAEIEIASNHIRNLDLSPLEELAKAADA